MLRWPAALAEGLGPSRIQLDQRAQRARVGRSPALRFRREGCNEPVDLCRAMPRRDTARDSAAQKSAGQAPARCARQGSGNASPDHHLWQPCPSLGGHTIVRRTKATNGPDRHGRVADGGCGKTERSARRWHFADERRCDGYHAGLPIPPTRPVACRREMPVKPR